MRCLILGLAGLPPGGGAPPDAPVATRTNQLDRRMRGSPQGVLSGGPNPIFMSDPVAGPLRGRCAPETCRADDSHAFGVNEVTINWNAPLLWVSAWLSERRR